MAASTRSIRAGSSDDLSQHVPMAGYKGYSPAQAPLSSVPRGYGGGAAGYGAAQGGGVPVLRKAPRADTREDPSQHMPVLTTYSLPAQHVPAQHVAAQYVPVPDVPRVPLSPPMGTNSHNVPGLIPTRQGASLNMELQQRAPAPPASTTLPSAGIPGMLAATQGSGGAQAWQSPLARDSSFGSFRAPGISGGMPHAAQRTGAAEPAQGPSVQNSGFDQTSPSKKLAVPDSIGKHPSSSPPHANQPSRTAPLDDSKPSSFAAAFSQEGPLARAPTSPPFPKAKTAAADPALAALSQLSLSSEYCASDGASGGERGASLMPSSLEGEEDAMVCRRFTYEQLKAATDNFSPANFLTRGSYDVVYKGRLMGCTVAVKRLEGGGWQGPSEYRTEVEVLSRMRHPHIVLLMGHCPEELCLVYEYLSGGNLLGMLGPSQGARPLRWFDRVRISVEVADALMFLHHHEPPIVHRDLNLNNVLIDRNLSTKLADVGLARLLLEDDMITAGPKGTPGYIDPAEITTCEVSVLGDVYAYGLIGLQLLTGEKSIALLNRFLEDGRASGPRGLSRLADAVMGRLDPSAGNWPADLARQLAVLFLRCSDPLRARRPDLAEEVQPILQRAAERAEREAQRKLEGLEAQLMCPLSKSLGWSSFSKCARRRMPPCDMVRGVTAEEIGALLHLCVGEQQRMADPVLAADGFTYERSAIEAWMLSSSASPLTGQPLEHKFLVPNNGLRQLLLSS